MFIRKSGFLRFSGQKKSWFKLYDFWQTCDLQNVTDGSVFVSK